MTRTRIRTQLAPAATVVLAVLVPALLSACGSDDAEAQAEPAAPEPRFATVDELVERYNELNTKEPVQARASLELFHAETPMQKRYINIARKMIPFAELDYAVYTRFGEGLRPGGPTGHMLMPDEPAEITTREPDRAQATLTDRHGEQHTLYFIRVDGDWRVSGYTLEYGPFKDVDNIIAFEQMVNKMSEVAGRVRPRVESGDLTSIEQVRTAFSESFAPDNR